MALYIGIDLGTTFSAVATLDKTGRPMILDNSDKLQSPKKNITSSCVKVDNDKLVVGDEARKAFQMGEKNAIGRFKPDIGSSKKFKVGGSQFSAMDLSAAVLKTLKKIAEDSSDSIAEVVITVPANFSHEARTNTIKAAKLAGLNVQNIIDEPTAAALFYAFKSGDSITGNFAVYDLGGGTFDVSVIKLFEGKEVEVITSDGLQRLGGDDFDKALIKIMKKKFESKFDVRFESNVHYSLDEAEQDKIVLSHVQKIQKIIEGEIFEITREEFEEEISPLIEQTLILCESVLKEAKLDENEIDAVFLAGGSTRIPKVLECIERIFGKKPTQTENVDEIVALGASLYAAYRSDRKYLTATQEASVNKMHVQDVTSDYFGTLAFRNDNKNEKMEEYVDIIIEKNAKRPCENTEVFFTRYEGQEAVDCSVTQSKTSEEDPKFVNVIWQGKLKLPKNRPAEREIHVTFSYDVNSIMHCKFEDKETGKITEIDLSMDESQPTSEIDKFLVD